MKFYVIIAALVACTCAAPTAELQHPSPINPSVLVEVKPEEKIILITDPQEFAKFKRETRQPFYPTVLPTQEHHMAKREQKVDHKAKSQIKDLKAPTTAKTTLQKPHSPTKPTPNKRNRRDVQSQTKAENYEQLSTVEFQKLQSLPAEKILQETHEERNNYRQEIPQASINKEYKDNKDDINVVPEVYMKPQGLLDIYPISTHQQKRDIPEEYSKQNLKKQINEEVSKHVTPGVLQKSQSSLAISSSSAAQFHKRDISVPENHPEANPKEINEKQRQQGEKKEVKSENEDTSTQQHKRDIPVPLVPKHHHAEESKKEGDENEAHEDKKEVTSESKRAPAQNQDHVTIETFQKPQTLPFIIKESHEDKKHKRDIQMPLDSKHDSEEFPKNNNEKNFENSQMLQTHNQEHVSTEKYLSQTLPTILKETSNDWHQQHDTAIPLISKRESPKDNNTQKENNGEQIMFTGFQKPQALPTHHYEYFHSQSLQQPTILPVIRNESTDNTYHQNHDIPVPVMDHNPHEKTRTGFYVNKREAAAHSNIDEVQVEDLSESKPYQKPIPHTLPFPEDHKPNIEDDHLIARDSTTSSTTDHPLLVGELFARY